MWEEFIQTRATNNVDELSATFEFTERPAVMEKWARGYYGTDILGHPLFIDIIGKANPKEVFSVVSEERFFQYLFHDYERFVKHRTLAMSHHMQIQINELSCIMDLKGFGLTKLTKSIKKMVGDALKISSGNYPETMAMTIIINTPVSFKTAWAIFKGFLDEK